MKRETERYGILPARVAAAFIATALFVAVRPAGAHAEFISAVTLGYDSFIDRFTILEVDTAETVHEFYAGITNGLRCGTGAVKLGLNNLFRIGNQTVDDNIDGALSLTPSDGTRIELRSNVHWRHYQEGSDYSFGNDYTQANNYLKLRQRVRDGLILSIKNRFEIVDYEERTEFDYDYRYFDTGAECELGTFMRRFARFSAALGFKEAPDTTALSYRRTLAEMEFHIASDGGTMVNVGLQGDRRDYRESVRSSYWYILSNTELSYVGLSGRSVQLRFESETTAFDSPTTTYFDTNFLRTGLRLKIPVCGAVTAFAEPRLAWMLCEDFAEERYSEATVVCGVDVAGGETFWATCSIEPGYRDYSIVENDLYSDFYVTRVSLMGSLSLPRDLTLNLFVSHDPERHTRRDDDFSITLISIDITKRL